MTHTEIRERDRKILEILRDGGSIADVQEFYGCRRSKIQSIARENGMTSIRADTKTSTFEILRLLLSGIPASEIAKKFRLTRQRVGQVKQRAIEAGFIFAKNQENLENPLDLPPRVE